MRAHRSQHVERCAARHANSFRSITAGLCAHGFNVCHYVHHLGRVLLDRLAAVCAHYADVHGVFEARGLLAGDSELLLGAGGLLPPANFGLLKSALPFSTLPAANANDTASRNAAISIPKITDFFIALSHPLSVLVGLSPILSKNMTVGNEACPFESRETF